jgi:SNF2 family DNA or RNA helicase
LSSSYTFPHTHFFARLCHGRTAINRTHRIGQNRKTYVWRYIVEGTVEVKIDKFRTEQQEDQLEDLISDGKKSMIKAGGIDGGFQSQEELLDILQL